MSVSSPGKIQSYRDLVVWQKAMDLVVTAYRIAARLPDHERYGLATQMRRAAVSIPANIAEGYGRCHRGDYIHHLSVANGSVKELETHFQIAIRLNYLPSNDVDLVLQQADEVGRMLAAVIAKLKTK